jgi:predicted Zn-dependent protease
MSKEKLVIYVLILIFSSTIFYFACKTFAPIIENKAFPAHTSNQLEKAYAADIASLTDINLLMDLGQKLLYGNQTEAAIINFKRVTELQKNYRDGWLYLGIAELKNNDPFEALKNIQTAEKLDPINALTYQYLAIAYEETGDAGEAQKAKDKMNYLTKTK